jgi:hypothetical protein
MILIPYHIVLLFLFGLISTELFGQETIFSGLKSESRRADSYFVQGNYPQALKFYLSVEKRGKGTPETPLKIARTYYEMNDPVSAVQWFQKSEDSLFTKDDILYFSESLITVGEYEEAIEYLKFYQEHHDSSSEIIKKIWRISNIHHLYEDSIYYSIRPLDLNTRFAEFGPAYFQDGMIFISNRKRQGGIESIDASDHSGFHKLYYARSPKGSGMDFSLVEPFDLNAKFNLGGAAFFPDQKKMIFTRNSTHSSSREGSTTLKLFFAEYRDGSWKETGHFPFNSDAYSISHPNLNEDGTILYFVSDQPGGQGGKDIYRSVLENEEWSQPENLGPGINTYEDESFPFQHNDRHLYFASRGHGGFGGLDIFRADIDPGPQSEIINLGHPVNSPFDDFGFILNKEGIRGYMSSNRINGKKDDDLYAVEVDLQTYPLLISGILKYKTNGWEESEEIQRLQNAELLLIDNDRDIVVFKTQSDDQARFSLEIPYSSHYKIKIISNDIGEHIVSLQIPKNKKMHRDHEIVVVEDKFKNQ